MCIYFHHYSIKRVVIRINEQQQQHQQPPLANEAVPAPMDDRSAVQQNIEQEISSRLEFPQVIEYQSTPKPTNINTQPAAPVSMPIDNTPKPIGRKTKSKSCAFMNKICK